MSGQSASQEVTKAIANTSTRDINRMVGAANSSKEKRRKLAEEKARREAEQKAKEEAAVRVSHPMQSGHSLTPLDRRKAQAPAKDETVESILVAASWS